MALVKVSIDIFRIGNKLSNNKIKEINLLDALPYKEQKEEIPAEEKEEPKEISEDILKKLKIEKGLYKEKSKEELIKVILSNHN